MSLGYISGSLPQEWETPFLKDMVYPKQWKTISVKDLTPSGYTVYGANGKIGFYSEYTHENPTIMLTCRGATCGNIHISEPFSYINGNAMALDNQPINLLGLHFLKYALQARGLEDTISGSAQPQITRQGLEKVQVPLPPLAEQKIIAEKLDTLLAQVDSTKARLEQIPQILKRFRQAVLGAAVSGNLTEAWRRKNNFNFDNWENLTLGHIVKKIEAGKNLKCIEIPPDNHQYGIIKISAVTWGEYDEEESKTLPDNSLFIESRRISVGDFLISRANTLELLGNPVIVKQVTKNLMLSDKVLRLVMEDYDKPWINIFLRSFYGRREIEFRSTGNQLSMRNIGQKALLEIPIPKPPIEEQAEIVRRVEQLFAYADTIEKQVNNALVRVNNLTQSILAKAFRGELTAQWRAENPDLISGENSAAALLEKIKAERAASGGKKASRKKS
ncbi:hypothetical protein FJ881_08285 [Escherichia albertii]|uniref:restriction endonuclease subunit S n=2 Tax=Escherichia albertii TaxID=208962 RepID=UPI0002BC25B6|nr:restriction endonuclease subunit S [Escherichia albertii]EFB1499951.1 hypothetical protein [Escherichia albertii]MCU7272746.1 restriction endonuclease subunit S [Escherichia albertii]WDB92299.1 restriction endonuclease subunit S [Escherichia albertii]HAX3254654.1 hypothetical protein [Escherichia albertii]